MYAFGPGLLLIWDFSPGVFVASLYFKALRHRFLLQGKNKTSAFNQESILMWLIEQIATEVNKSHKLTEHTPLKTS